MLPTLSRRPHIHSRARDGSASPLLSSLVAQSDMSAGTVCRVGPVAFCNSASLVCSRSLARQRQAVALGRNNGNDPVAGWVLRPTLSGSGRGTDRSAASAAAPAASAAAAATAAAAAAAEVTFFPAAVWVKWTAAVIGIYLTYWLGLATFMPRSGPTACTAAFIPDEVCACPAALP